MLPLLQASLRHAVQLCKCPEQAFSAITPAAPEERLRVILTECSSSTQRLQGPPDCMPQLRLTFAPLFQQQEQTMWALDLNRESKQAT